MVCKVKVVYHNQEIVLEENAHIDFRFLQENFGISLTKDFSRNPLVLLIQTRNATELWVSKNSFTTSVFVKFKESEAWKSLLVSDSFKLETEAYIKIDKYELKLEKVSNRNALFETPKPQNTLNWNNRNTQASIKMPDQTSLISPQNYQVPLKPKEEHPKPASPCEEESDEFWDLIDSLLQNDQKKNENKTSPKKQDLIVESPKKIPMCVLDPDEEEMIEALLTQHMAQSRDASRLLNSSQKERCQSPMSIEVIQHSEPYNIDTSTRATDMIEIESQKTSKDKASFSSPRMETEEEESKTNFLFLSPSNNGYQERLEPRSSQMLSQAARSNRCPRGHKEEGKNSALSKSKQLELVQLINDKREENHKGSAIKMLSQQPKNQAKECSICLSDIEEMGKINSCTHLFCFTCIKDWGAVTNQCPLCKGRFEEITHLSSNGQVLETVPIAFKQQVYEDEEQLNQLETDDGCYICNQSNDPSSLLICDNCEFFCCHTYCCNPPLDEVPLGDWICNFCTQRTEDRRRVNQQRREQRRLQNEQRRLQNEQRRENAYNNRQTRNQRTIRNNWNNPGNNNTYNNNNNNNHNHNHTTATITTTTTSHNTRGGTKKNPYQQLSLDSFAFRSQRRNSRIEIEEEEEERPRNRSTRNRRSDNTENVIVLEDDDDDEEEEEEVVVRRSVRTTRNQRRIFV